jgi:hypothetical protein
LRLQELGTFLDVGWLAIEAAQSWPALHVVGFESIETFSPMRPVLFVLGRLAGVR